MKPIEEKKMEIVGKHFHTWFSDWLERNKPYLTNKKVGEAAGVTSQRITQIKRRDLPTRKLLHAIADYFPWDLEQAEWRAGMVPANWMKLPTEDYAELFQIIRLILLCKEKKIISDDLRRYLNAFIEGRNEG
jgi:DNA-binding XRE family transcriptional regulator